MIEAPVFLPSNTTHFPSVSVIVFPATFNQPCDGELTGTSVSAVVTEEEEEDPGMAMGK